MKDNPNRDIILLAGIVLGMAIMGMITYTVWVIHFLMILEKGGAG
ncbi:hypothetical protein [Echinicola strongylocentroti]|nr:hypothetical protein [Echinicola strongylocentroti]